MNRLKKIKSLRNLAKKAELENREILFRYPMNELCALYNGIGPEWFPEELRSFITKLHPDLEAAAMIHDLEWNESDGSVKGFLQSNARFRRNGGKLAAYRYAWYDPRRWIVRNQALRFAVYCELFGYPGWKQN